MSSNPQPGSFLTSCGATVQRHAKTCLYGRSVGRCRVSYSLCALFAWMGANYACCQQETNHFPASLPSSSSPITRQTTISNRVYWIVLLSACLLRARPPLVGSLLYGGTREFMYILHRIPPSMLAQAFSITFIMCRPLPCLCLSLPLFAKEHSPHLQLFPSPLANKGKGHCHCQTTWFAAQISLVSIQCLHSCISPIHFNLSVFPFFPSFSLPSHRLPRTVACLLRRQERRCIILPFAPPRLLW